jgi:hypothetical protein
MKKRGFEAVIGAAIDVHKELGQGLVERGNEEALCHELALARAECFFRQRSVADLVQRITPFGAPLA